MRMFDTSSASSRAASANPRMTETAAKALLYSCKEESRKEQASRSQRAEESRESIEIAKKGMGRAEVLCLPRSGSKFAAWALSQNNHGITYQHEPFATQYLHGCGAAFPINFHGVSWLFAAYPDINARRFRLVRHPIDNISSIYRRGFLTMDNPYGNWAAVNILKQPDLLTSKPDLDNAVRFFVAWDNLINRASEDTPKPLTIRVEDFQEKDPNKDDPNGPTNKGDRPHQPITTEDIFRACARIAPVHIASYMRRYAYDF